MTLKKYGDASKAEVFRGDKAAVVNEHLKKVGKSLEDFSDDERKDLHKDLDAVAEEKSDDVSDAR